MTPPPALLRYINRADNVAPLHTKLVAPGANIPCTAEAEARLRHAMQTRRWEH